MAGYKMKNGSKNYMIKSYRDGGLVETKEYKDGKTVVTESTRVGLGDLVPLIGGRVGQLLLKKIRDEDLKRDPSKRLDKFSKPKKK